MLLPNRNTKKQPKMEDGVSLGYETLRFAAFVCQEAVYFQYYLMFLLWSDGEEVQ